jgi:hypothetical protein
VTAFPVIETINQDISEFIATNVISITDGQLYTSKKLFIDRNRPAIDSALSVSRIGSNAQCRMMKYVASGVKNELTNFRLSMNDTKSNALVSLNTIFYQDHCVVSDLNFTMTLLCLHRNGLYIGSDYDVQLVALILASHQFYYSYIIHLMKTTFSKSSQAIMDYMVTDLTRAY